MSDEFDLDAELSALKQHTQIRKRHKYARSRLDKYQSELLRLRRGGANIVELQHWLRKQRVKVAHSTVSRWLKKHG